MIIKKNATLNFLDCCVYKVYLQINHAIKLIKNFNKEYCLKLNEKNDCIINTKIEVINLSKVILKPKSTLLVKIFSGKDENILIKNVKDFFKSIERIKPDSSRKESREMYLLCKNLKKV